MKPSHDWSDDLNDSPGQQEPSLAFHPHQKVHGGPLSFSRFLSQIQSPLTSSLKFSAAAAMVTTEGAITYRRVPRLQARHSASPTVFGWSWRNAPTRPRIFAYSRSGSSMYRLSAARQSASGKQQATLPHYDRRRCTPARQEDSSCTGDSAKIAFVQKAASTSSSNASSTARSSAAVGSHIM